MQATSNNPHREVYIHSRYDENLPEYFDPPNITSTIDNQQLNHFNPPLTHPHDPILIQFCVPPSEHPFNFLHNKHTNMSEKSGSSNYGGPNSSIPSVSRGITNTPFIPLASLVLPLILIVLIHYQC